MGCNLESAIIKNHFPNNSSRNDVRSTNQYNIEKAVVQNLPSIEFNLQRVSIQAKMRISQPEDIFEREANEISKQIVNESLSVDSIRGINHKQKLDQKLPGNNDQETVDVGTNEGHMLDSTTQDFVENQLGYNFGEVRIHTDEQATWSARMINARAYTLGHDIFFQSGEYAPSTPEGKKLLLHELVHVVQQNASPSNASTLNNSTRVILRGNNTIHALEEPRLRTDIRIARQEDEINETTRESWEENLRLWRRFLEENGIKIEDLESIGPPPEMPTSAIVAAQVAPVPTLRPPPGPVPIPTGPGGRVIPFPRPPPVIGPSPRPIPVPAWALWIIPIGILLWPSKTAPPWIDEINLITGRPYKTKDEYDMVRRLSPNQREALGRWIQRLQPYTQPIPQPVPSPEKKRRRNLHAYPLYWPILLLPPPIFRNGIPWITFARTNAERDEDQAKQARMQLQWRQYRDPDFDAIRYHVHHIIPLFLGGPDDILVNNGIIWPASVHLHGHRILRYQPQMADPSQTDPLPPISPDMYDHIAGTPYELVGFKD